MRIEIISVIFLFCLIALSQITTAYAQDPIVYSRCERTSETFDLTANVTVNGQVETITRTMAGLDIYDILPDVTNFFSDFSAPCDLVFRDANGTETVIFDCSSNSTQTASCAALDAAVSFDGNTIAFSVFHGSISNYSEQIHSQVVHPDAEPVNLGYYDFPNKLLNSTGAHLHFYTVANGELRAIPFQEGVYDSGPAFISNQRIAFTSTRDNHTTTVVWGTTASKKGTRIWTVDIDGKNPDLASHHSLSQEQHPYILRDGRLAYSSWQIFGGLPFRYTNHGAGSHTTIDNLFHIYAQDPDGAVNFPIYGQHSGDHNKSYFGADHKAAHFITQSSDNRVWFADYYRKNNKGLGNLVGVIPEPKGQEGKNPLTVSSHTDFFVPNNVINFAAWSHSDDTSSFTTSSIGNQTITHSNYADPLPFAGKLGHPAALSDNDLMVAWGKGACSVVISNKIFTELGREKPPLTDGGGGGVAMNLITSLEMDTPGCDVGIYRATQIPSQHPNDLEMIVDSKEWHEIMARAVVPYSAIHGVEHPDIIERADIRTTHSSLETGTPFGLLGAASVTDRETHPAGGIHFAGEHQFHLQGTDTIDYTDDDLCGVRILGNMPNRNKNVLNEIANIAGERVTILGEFPVLNRHTDGSRVIDASDHPDTSFLVRMPANMPYLMQGVDCDGRTLNTDQTWQSLRPGEQKTCNGCHVHSRPGRTQFDSTFAASSEYTIPRLGEGVVPLLSGKSGNTVETRTVPGYGMRIEFTQDIKPIFDQHCISCHGGSNPAAGLALDNTGGNNRAQGSTWWCLVVDKDQTCVTPENQMATGAGYDGITFRRPQLTRYIRAFNSRGSLLYWKAANQRADNRTDAQYSDDIDFGSNHPTTISAEELGVLSRWIDIGVPGGGATELYDTQKPTLHLAADDGDLTQLRVGTVDLGSGIDPGSLVVCVLDNSGNCNNLAGSAQLHGITTVNMGSLGDPDTEIYARVKDMAGNTTEVYRTVGWFQNSDSGTTNTGDNQAPNITITNPGSNTEVSGTIPIEVNYSDNVGVVSVSLYINGQLHNQDTQAPFSFTLDTTTLDDGHYSLSAVALDAANNQSSSGIAITVKNGTGPIPGGTTDTEAPIVTVFSPSSFATVSGTAPVSFETYDNVGITRVDLYANAQLVGSSTQSPFTINWDTTQTVNGTGYLQARAFDAAGNQGVSFFRNINVNNDGTTGPAPDTTPPAISIVSPASGIVSGTFSVLFDVSDNVDVTAVELYVDGQLQGRDTQTPFAFSLDSTELSNGNHTLSALAFDAAGNQGTSANVIISVGSQSSDTEAPIVTVFSPSPFETVSGTVPVSFETYDNIGITRVDLYANNTQVGSSTQSPFTINWDTTQTVNGTGYLQARAFDAAGNQGISFFRNVNVDNDTTTSPTPDTIPPTISIVSPAPGTVSGTLSVLFDVSDNIDVTAVELYIDGKLQARDPQAPFTFTIDSTDLTNGNHTLNALAFDAAGNQGTSANVVISVNNNQSSDTEAPIVTVFSPSPFETVSGTVPVSFETYDNVGITRIDLYANDALVGSNTQSPFTINWDTTQTTNGTGYLQARAFDAAGNQGVSFFRNVNVSNSGTTGPASDTTPPSINIVSPAPGAVSGTFSVLFDVSDNVDVTTVELYVDGQLQGKDSHAPFSFTLHASDLTNGNHTLSARAFDAAGNQGTSANVVISVDNNQSKDTEAPIVTVFSPASFATVSGTVPVSFETYDNVGITRIDLYANNTQVGSSTQSPFTIDWDTTQTVNGTGYLQARAFDAAGNQGVSFFRNVNVHNEETTGPSPDTTPPTISIVSPASGTVSGTFSVLFDASDNVDVTAVELYVDGQLQGRDPQAPFTFTIDSTELSNGNHTLNARAFDAAGNQGTSADVVISVGNSQSSDTEAPIVTVYSPASFATVSGTVPVSFETYDNVGITRIDLYANDQLVGSNTQSPFTINWDTTQTVNGTGYLQARAFDAAGNQGISFFRNINVHNEETTNPAPDTTPPTISIVSPTSGTVSGTFSVLFDASDNVDVTAVELYVDGQLQGRDPQAPFTFTIDSTELSNGNHTLNARAFDAAGNQGTSADVVISVGNNQSSDTEAPIVTVYSPASFATVSGTVPVSFETYDNVGITRIDLYANDQLVGSSTQSPFTINWDTTQTVDGTGYLQARAFDAAGNRGTSFFRNIVVNNN